MNWSFTNPGLPTRMHFTTIGKQEERNQNQNFFNLVTNVEKGKQAKINAEQHKNNKVKKREVYETEQEHTVCLCIVFEQQPYHQN